MWPLLWTVKHRMCFFPIAKAENDAKMSSWRLYHRSKGKQLEKEEQTLWR